MKIKHKGFSIEVESKIKEGLWAADIWIWMLNQNVTPISERAELTDYSSPEEAEEIGLLLAKDRIDLYLLRDL